MERLEVGAACTSGSLHGDFNFLVRGFVEAQVPFDGEMFAEPLVGGGSERQGDPGRGRERASADAVDAEPSAEDIAGAWEKL